MNTENPKIFISYAWSSQKTQDAVLELAERLRYDGIDVVLDKWDFKEGNDKYAFMERCVTDENIDRVLIICDKAYQERADGRQGGVGDETFVISSEVYGHMQQTKFIPLVFERDEYNNPFMPAYIKSKKYIDFSDEVNYEKSYEVLLRVLYDMPVNKKPKLGKKPDWLQNEDINHNELNILIKSLKCDSTENLKKYQSICVKFTDTFINLLNEFRFKNDQFNADELVKKISSLKPIRDVYFDFLEVILESEFFSARFITNFFERIYNEVGNIENGSYTYSTFEYYDFFRWESFIGTIATLLHYDKYAEVYNILNHTYFLKDGSSINSSLIPKKFSKFRTPFYTLETDYKKNHSLNYLSCAAQLLTEREKLPILRKQTLAETDLLLYQLSTIYFSDEQQLLYWKWFPVLYPYVRRKDLWIKLKSCSFCQSIFPLFNVKNISGLKLEISKATCDSSVRHNGAWESAPNILAYISVEQIGTLN